MDTDISHMANLGSRNTVVAPERSQRKRNSYDAGYTSGYDADSEEPRPGNLKRPTEFLTAPVMPPLMLDPNIKEGHDSHRLDTRDSMNERLVLPNPFAGRITLPGIATLFPDESGEINAKVTSLRRWLEASYCGQQTMPMEKFVRSLANAYVSDLERCRDKITDVENEMRVAKVEVAAMQGAKNDLEWEQEKLEEAFADLVRTNMELQRVSDGDKKSMGEFMERLDREQGITKSLREEFKDLQRKCDELKNVQQYLKVDNGKLKSVASKFKVERDKIKIANKRLNLNISKLSWEKQRLVLELWASKLHAYTTRISLEVDDEPEVEIEAEEDGDDCMVHDTDMLMSP